MMKHNSNGSLLERLKNSEQSKRSANKRKLLRIEVRKWLEVNSVYLPGEAVKNLYEILYETLDKNPPKT